MFYFLGPARGFSTHVVLWTVRSWEKNSNNGTIKGVVWAWSGTIKNGTDGFSGENDFIMG